ITDGDNPVPNDRKPDSGASNAHEWGESRDDASATLAVGVGRARWLYRVGLISCPAGRPCVIASLRILAGSGSGAATPAQNNFPAGERLPRAANSSVPAVLLCVSAARQCNPPSPTDRFTTRTRWARP